MENSTFVYRTEQSLGSSSVIISPLSETEQEFQEFSANTKIALCLTDITEALEVFQDFDYGVRRKAIALRASELGVTQLHFYAIARHLSLEVFS